jgi:hypothetical protein
MPPPPFPLSPLGAWRRAREPDYFVREMSILHGGIGLSWPNDLEFSADGLRPDAIPAEAMLAEDRPFDKNTPGESAGLVAAHRDGHQGGRMAPQLSQRILRRLNYNAAKPGAR